MSQDASLLDLSSEIYDAVLSPERWPCILQTLKARLDASDCGFVNVDKGHSRIVFAADAAGIVGRDGEPRLDRRLTDGLGRATGETFAGAGGLPADCRARELAARLDGAGDGPFLGLVIANDAGHYAAVFATRRPDRPVFSRAEQALMAGLHPHFRRGHTLGRRLLQAEHERGAALAALDRLAAGVLVVDGHGQVRFCNGQAEAILAENDGLALGQDGLRTDSVAETAALHEAILGASRAEDDGCGTVTVLSVRRPSMCQPLELLVAPLTAAGGAAAEVAQGALVFVSDPERRPRMASDALVHLYGLSRAEADLAAELASGKTLAQFADERARKIETARKTLKRVFAKTDTGRQAELVGRLLSGPLTFVNGSAVGD